MPTRSRGTAGEANTRSGCFQATGSGTPDKQFLGSETEKKGATSWTAGRMTTPYWGIGRRKNERGTDTGDSGLGTERTHSTGLAGAS